MGSEPSNIKVRYDADTDAAYINLAPGHAGHRTTTNCEGPEEGDWATINLDWSEDHRLVGIEVFSARQTLPQELLDLAD